MAENETPRASSYFSSTSTILSDAVHPEKPFLVKFSEHVASMSRPAALLIGYGLMMLLAMMDYITGFWIGLSRFYLVPVLLVTWAAGRRAGVLITFVSIGTWILSDHLTRRWANQPIIPYWNALVRLGFLLISAYLLSALRQAWEGEKKLARTDFLTGVANRRQFFERARDEIRRSRRYRHSFIVSYLDIDGFKKVNDRFGHHAGDELLKIVASTMKKTVREVDVVARLGGDEFAILLPETGAQAAKEVMRKVHSNLYQVVKDQDWPVTFSIGTVTYVSPPVSVYEMIKTADHIMYRVKNSGKDTIHYEVAGHPT